MAELIVKSKVKEAAEGMNVGGDVYNELNRRVTLMLKDASGRAKSNGRKTIQAKDL